MRKTYRTSQFLSNIATVVIAILLCVITVKLFFPTSPTVNIAGMPGPNNVPGNSTSSVTTAPPQITPIGKAMPLENIDWKNNKKTLVLYIATTCRFCNESSPFYKRLVEKYADDKNVKLVAVLPQTVNEAKEHLKSLGVNINDVYNAQLRSIGVTATPTLLLVNDSGVVSEMWRGKLTTDKETEVLNKLSS
ncbi:MAG: peroxiredoxin family protein [Pyrinomonadaceae bacterium]